VTLGWTLITLSYYVVVNVQQCTKRDTEKVVNDSLERSIRGYTERVQKIFKSVAKYMEESCAPWTGNRTCHQCKLL